MRFWARCFEHHEHHDHHENLSSLNRSASKSLVEVFSFEPNDNLDESSWRSKSSTQKTQVASSALDANASLAIEARQRFITYDSEWSYLVAVERRLSFYLQFLLAGPAPWHQSCRGKRTRYCKFCKLQRPEGCWKLVGSHGAMEPWIDPNLNLDRLLVNAFSPEYKKSGAGMELPSEIWYLKYVSWFQQNCPSEAASRLAPGGLKWTLRCYTQRFWYSDCSGLVLVCVPMAQGLPGEACGGSSQHLSSRIIGLPPLGFKENQPLQVASQTFISMEQARPTWGKRWNHTVVRYTVIYNNIQCCEYLVHMHAWIKYSSFRRSLLYGCTWSFSNRTYCFLRIVLVRGGVGRGGGGDSGGSSARDGHSSRSWWWRNKKAPCVIHNHPGTNSSTNISASCRFLFVSWPGASSKAGECEAAMGLQ